MEERHGDRGVRKYEGGRDFTIHHMQMSHHRDPELYGLEMCLNLQMDAENPLEKNLWEGRRKAVRFPLT